MTIKLVSDNQGRETARLARGVGLERSAYQAALTDGRVEKFFRGLIPNPLEYPDWVRKHMTPEFEATALRDPGKVELWLDPRQEASPYPTGHDVYGAIKEGGLLERSLSYGDLKFFEANPDKIPDDWRRRGLWVYAWASVVQSSDGHLLVPCLHCGAGQPWFRWGWLGDGWDGYEPAGLRK